MSEVKINSELLDNAVSSLRQTRSMLAVQRDGLDNVIEYINNGFYSSASTELIGCIKKVKSSLSNSVSELNKAADEINSYKGLVGYIENLFL